MATGDGDAPTTPSVDSPMLNQAQEMVCCLFNQSQILDKCQVRVAQAMGTAVSKHSTQLFLPFMSYLSDVSGTVEAWHAKIMVLCPEMAHCDYNTYHNCAVDIWEKTREYFGKLRDLNAILDQRHQLPNPSRLSNPATSMIREWDCPLIH